MVDLYRFNFLLKFQLLHNSGGRVRFSLWFTSMDSFFNCFCSRFFCCCCCFRCWTFHFYCWCLFQFKKVSHEILNFLCTLLTLEVLGQFHLFFSPFLLLVNCKTSLWDFCVKVLLFCGLFFVLSFLICFDKFGVIENG